MLVPLHSPSLMQMRTLGERSVAREPSRKQDRGAVHKETLCEKFGRRRARHLRFRPA
jgi:hypothetical protein